MAPVSLLGPAKGHLGHFGAQVLTKLRNVPYNAQMEAFTASFCAMLAGFWAVLGRLGLLGCSGALLGPFAGFGALFGPFGDHSGLS